MNVTGDDPEIIYLDLARELKKKKKKLWNMKVIVIPTVTGVL